MEPIRLHVCAALVLGWKDTGIVLHVSGWMAAVGHLVPQLRTYESGHSGRAWVL